MFMYFKQLLSQTFSDNKYSSVGLRWLVVILIRRLVNNLSQ